MHGLIFETSVWLLAESTRLLSSINKLLLRFNTENRWTKGWQAAPRVFTHKQYQEMGNREFHIGQRGTHAIVITGRTINHQSFSVLFDRNSRHPVTHSLGGDRFPALPTKVCTTRIKTYEGRWLTDRHYQSSSSVASATSPPNFLVRYHFAPRSNKSTLSFWVL